MSEAEIYFFKTTPPSAPLHPPTRSFRQLTDTTVNVKQRDSCDAIVLRYSQIFHELLFFCGNCFQIMYLNFKAAFTRSAPETPCVKTKKVADFNCGPSSPVYFT